MKYLIAILFLITLFTFLIFYNIKYIPLRDAYLKLWDENKMWREEVAELKKRTEELESSPTRKFSLLWDDLFPNDESFLLKEEGKAQLNTIIPEIMKEGGDVYIYSYGLASPPKNLIKIYPSNWEFTNAKGKAVASYLILMGVPKERIYVVSHIATNEVSSEKPPRRCDIIIQP